MIVFSPLVAEAEIASAFWKAEPVLGLARNVETMAVAFDTVQLAKAMQQRSTRWQAPARRGCANASNAIAASQHHRRQLRRIGLVRFQYPD